MESPAAQPPDEDRPPGVLEADRELVSDISALIDAGERGMVMNLVADLYPADLAQLLSHLPRDEAKILFHWLPAEPAGQVLADLDDDFRADLLEEAHPDRLTALLDHLETDDAADVLADLHPEVVQQVLLSLEDSEDLRELLSYPEESAGGIMATEFVAVPAHWNVQEATEEVRREAESVEDIYEVYAIDPNGKLLGIVSLKDLLLHPAETRVADILEPDPLTVKADVDQEEVGRIMQRYDLVSLPVVSEQGRMLGVITIDDVVDVIREEAEEDIHLMHGMTGREVRTDSILRITRGRLPWLVMGMVGAGLSGLVINHFQGALQQAVVLASFIPIMMATAGNAGIQSSAIIVRGLASGELWSSDVMRRVGKELSVGLLNGALLGAILALFVLVVHIEGSNLSGLAITAGLSMQIVIILATVVGATVPLILDRMG
ncbi:MAG: magnesium transporter, partial [Rhodothermales bacterium]